MTSSLTSPINKVAALALMAAMGSACGQTAETPDPKPTQSTQVNTSAQTPSAPVPSISTTAKHANPQPARQRYRWQTIASGLDHPWGLAFVDDGFLVTERRGTLKFISASGDSRPIIGLPDSIDVGGQGGLLDVITDSDFRHNRTIYACFSEKGQGGNSTALFSATLRPDASALDDVKVIFSQLPKVDNQQHFGCRIAQDEQYLYLSLGDRYSQSAQAQQLDNHIGKIIRIHTDGSVPSDNPFIGVAGALAHIYSLGHRNAQGLSFYQGKLWQHEHGAKGGDELNIITSGANYGWPQVSYGVHYDGSKIGTGAAHIDGVTAPIYYYNPSIAPSGMTFITGTHAEPSGDTLLIGALRGAYVAKLHIQDDQVIHEEKIAVGQRVRDVRQSPTGEIYILTDSSDGQLLKLTTDR